MILVFRGLGVFEFGILVVIWCGCCFVGLVCFFVSLGFFAFLVVGFDVDCLLWLVVVVCLVRWLVLSP